MVGIPDGLGAFDNYDGTFTVLMNHEIRPLEPPEIGFVRQHGFGGAFVSHWIIRKRDLAVLHGGDQVKQVLEWSVPTSNAPNNSVSSGSFVPAERAMGRLCSADLPLPSAFYNGRSGKGYTGRIFMSGEEVGDEGRAFAHLVGGPGAGISYELPSLGKFSRENSLASPYEQDKTVVVGLDDTNPMGQVYVYIGEKQATGNEIEKAGLHGGSLYGVQVRDVRDAPIPLEDRTSGIPSDTRFSLQNFGDVSSGVIEITHLLRKNLQSLDWGRFDRDDDNEFDERFNWAKRGYRYYLGVTQAHYIADDPELVEGGQLYLIAAPRNVR